MNSRELEEFRATQIEQGDLWDELRVRHLWIHVVRGLVQDGVIADVGATAFAVYIAIKSHTDLQTGNAWPSIATLAKQVGCSPDTVERSQKKLVEAGLLKVEKRGRSNVYSVIERIDMVTMDGAPWGTAERKYASMQYGNFVEELQRLAKTGNLPGDRAITVNVTVNVQQITQNDGGTVVMTQNVQVNSDADLQRLLRKL
jgi:DNA-binding transcriptional regulator YhcF (GntR family)